MADDAGGTYTLVLSNEASATVEVGALGPLEFGADWYTYTGSALGPGGFARIARHREVATGDREVRHWHVDYLLGHDASRIETVERSFGTDAECEIASAIESAIDSDVDATVVTGFGSSDCDCNSHLVGHASEARLADAVRTAHSEIG